MSTSSNVENLSPEVIQQVSKELWELAANPPEGIKVFINEEDITDIQASIEGPAGTPYAEGLFRVRLVLGKDFPSSPPKGYFVTKIFHPNVARNGEICVNTLKKDWKSDLGLKHILLTIKCLLIVPNPESALNEEAGKLLLEQYDDYCERARMITEIHARPPKYTKEGLEEDPQSSTGTSASKGDGPTAKKHAGDKNKLTVEKKNLKLLKEKKRTIFKEKRSGTELGQEGNKIKKLKAQFTALYHNDKKVGNVDTFKEEIQNFIQKYNENIDIPKDVSLKQLLSIMKDARSDLNISLDVINTSVDNSFLLNDSKTQLKPEVVQWYKEVLKTDEFYKKFINAHPKIIQKKQFINALEADLSLSSTRTLTEESDDNTDLANSPIRNRGQQIEYNSKNIQQILLTSTRIKIGGIVDTTTIAQRQDRTHISGTDKLIERINLYLAKQNEEPQYYLVIDCISSTLVDAAYLANLRYSNKHQFWKLDIIPLVHYAQVENQESLYLSDQLKNVATNIWGPKSYYDTNINSVRFEQAVEHAKLRIKYFKLYPSNLSQYQSERSSITSSSPNSYRDQHYQESQINSQSLFMSPPYLSSDTDAEFTLPESVELSRGSGMITRSRAHTSQDLNNPQPSTSGVQLGQRRSNTDSDSKLSAA